MYNESTPTNTTPTYSRLPSLEVHRQGGQFAFILIQLNFNFTSPPAWGQWRRRIERETGRWRGRHWSESRQVGNCLRPESGRSWWSRWWSWCQQWFWWWCWCCWLWLWRWWWWCWWYLGQGTPASKSIFTLPLFFSSGPAKELGVMSCWAPLENHHPCFKSHYWWISLCQILLHKSHHCLVHLPTANIIVLYLHLKPQWQWEPRHGLSL